MPFAFFKFKINWRGHKALRVITTKMNYRDNSQINKSIRDNDVKLRFNLVLLFTSSIMYTSPSNYSFACFHWSQTL